MVPKTVLVVDPTHRDKDQLSEQLRALRKAEGLIDREERTFTRLVPQSWTNAEKGDAERYAGDEGAKEAHWLLAQRGLDVRLGWSKTMHEGAYVGRQPESLTAEERDRVIRPAMAR